MKTSELVAGAVYALKRGNAEYLNAECGVLLSTTAYELCRNYGADAPKLVPEPKPQAKSRYTLAWGYPVAHIFRAKDAERFAALDLARVDLTYRGHQEIDGIGFGVELHRARDFVSSWAYELVRQEEAGKAQTEARRAKQAKQDHLEEIKPKFKTLLGDVPHYVTYYGLVVTDADKLLTFLESLTTCTSCGKPIGDICWVCA